MLKELISSGCQKCWQAFEELKHRVITAVVLALPDSKEQFVVETFDSQKGMGAVLMQKGHPIAFISQVFLVKNLLLGLRKGTNDFRFWSVKRARIFDGKEVLGAN